MKTKFVRWLGAYGKGENPVAAALWESNQTDRQVAAEPLYRGKTLFKRGPAIGLAIAHPEDSFYCGYLGDVFSKPVDGILCTQTNAKKYRSMHRYLAAINWPASPYRYGEAFFNSPLYAAVVLRGGASNSAQRHAREIAVELNLKIVRVYDVR